MKLLLAALTIWSLPFFGISCGSASVQNPEPRKTESTPTPSGETVTLTSQHPTGSFLLQPDLLKNPPPAVLEITLTKVVNPAAKPVNIFVYLSSSNDKSDTAPEKIGVGNFSLYPVDRPAKFMLDAAPAFRKINETKNASNVKEWRLVFELGREAEPVEVTIAAPTWKTDKN
ncbi:MAG TPA: hypothetical protein VGJ37_05170 [Pyrinomonadaceae bacterium]|jgi:hypothetical protein